MRHSLFLAALAAWSMTAVDMAQAADKIAGETIAGPAKVISSEVVMVDNKFIRLVGYSSPSRGERCDLGAEVFKYVSRTSGDGAGVVIDGTKAHDQLVERVGTGGLFCFVRPVRMEAPPPQPGAKFIKLWETSEVVFNGICYRKFEGTFECPNKDDCKPSNGSKSVNEGMIALGYGDDGIYQIIGRDRNWAPTNYGHIRMARRAAVKEGLPLAVARDKNSAVCMSFSKYSSGRSDDLPLPTNLDLNDLMDK